jgi:hypothetical protein
VHVGGICDSIGIVRRDREILGQLLRSGISGCTIELSIRILASKRPTERMLPASASHDEQSHGFWAFLKASRADAAARFATSAM